MKVGVFPRGPAPAMQAELYRRASVLSGTISCRECAALVINENAERHRNWHRKLESDSE